EDQHGEAGAGAPERGGGPQSLVAEVGGQPHVDHDHVGVALLDHAPELREVGGRSDDLEPLGLQQQDESLAQQGVVLGDQDAHGNTTRITVGPPAGLTTSVRPSKAATLRRIPTRPVPSSSEAPPFPSSVTSMCRAVPVPRSSTRTCAASACLTAFVRASATTK